MDDLSCGIRMWAQVSFVLSHAFDRQTDGAVICDIIGFIWSFFREGPRPKLFQTLYRSSCLCMKPLHIALFLGGAPLKPRHSTKSPLKRKVYRDANFFFLGGGGGRN